MSSSPPINIDSGLDVLIVGAGMSGLYQLHKFRKLGYSVKIFEAGADLGGVWYWNCYPGARVDSFVPVYELSLQEIWEEWNWSERFPSRDELLRYFHYVASKLDLNEDIRFNTRVTGAQFSTSTNRWVVETENDIVVHPRFLVLCVGYAAKPYIPNFRGLENFRGICHHTAQWPQGGVDMQGKRVGVIGTGASGVQVIQTVAKEVSRLTVFQRTPNLCMPMRQETLNEPTQKKLKARYPAIFARRKQTLSGLPYDPYSKLLSTTSAEERFLLFEDLWDRGGPHFLAANFIDLLGIQETNDEVYAFWREKVRERLMNPKLQEKLAPTIQPHPLGAKRPALEVTYYDVFNQPNVELVDLLEHPIVEITQKGVLTADGVEHELDVIVLATGFDSVTGSITQIDIRGIDGSSIADKWKEGVYTNLGLACANFPNMFFVHGPQAPSGLCNGPTCGEMQGDWIVDCIRYMVNNRLTRIEAARDAETEWRRQVLEEADRGLLGKAKSWYTGANIPGKKVEILLYTGGVPKYDRICGEKAERGYEGFVVA